MALISDALQADSTAIYLVDKWHDSVSLPDLVPVAAYPSPSSAYAAPEAVLEDKLTPSTYPEALDLTIVSSGLETQNTTLRALAPVAEGHSLPVDAESSSAGDQLIIPLIHEGNVIGVLTSCRLGRPWQELEQRQWDRLAQTLTLACILDQRGQWFESRLQHSRDTQTQQSKRFHELLHQVRSPLTALKTFGKLLLKRLGPDSRHANMAQNILRQGDRIQDLLQYFDSTLKATDHQLAALPDSPTLLLPPANEDVPTNQDDDGELDSVSVDLEPLAHFGGHLQIIQCNLLAVLKPALESAKVLFQNQQLEFHITAEQDSAFVTADPKAIVEIINTLLENALKYSGHHALVWVQVGLKKSQSDRHFHGVLVGDTGPGIPNIDQPHIFERNYRGTQAKGDISGTGLGLAIVQDLVFAMSGDIDLFSPIETAPVNIMHSGLAASGKRGTIFVVWLPVAASA